MHIKPSSFQARDWKLHSLLCKDTKIYRIRHLSMKSWFIFPHQSLSLVLQMLLCEFTDKIKEHGKYLQIDIKHPLLGSYHIKRYKYFFYFQGRRKKKKTLKRQATYPLSDSSLFFLSTNSDSPKSFQKRKQSLTLGKFVDLNRFVCFTINHVFCWRKISLTQLFILNIFSSSLC